MRTPDDWFGEPGLRASLLAPLGCLYAAAGKFRRAIAKPFKAGVPVVCVGNLVAGGAGKTPVTQSLVQCLQAQSRKPAILLRGYGGSLSGPVRVDPARHNAHEVGDEALLHAALAPTWICADRALSAKAAIADGADIIVMDDGLQNPGLYQDLPLLVIDGEQAFGNGKIIPAGPLREPVEDAIARAKAIVLIGDDRRGILGLCEGKPVFRARIDVTNGDAFKGKPVVAFAGIGRPQKFFYSLEEAGAKLAMAFPFSDHHAYTACEIEALIEQAETLKADLVTTAKDHVRLPKEAQAKTKVLQIALRWEDPQAPARLLTPVQ